MTSVTDLFPSRYVSAGDLPAGGTDVIIESFGQEEVGDTKDLRPILFFAGKPKGMVLNKTNANRIAEKYGEQIEEWMGKPVTLYPSETDFQGKTVPCVRVRIPASNGAATQKQATF